MTLRIAVGYAATDGTMPESVEIEWADVLPDPDQVHTLVSLLVRAPAARMEKYMTDQPAEPALAELGLVLEDPVCITNACGHLRSDHAVTTQTGPTGPPIRRYDECKICADVDRCVRYTGEGQGWRE